MRPDARDRIAIAGGTGWVGRLVVDAVRLAGAEPVVMARSTGVDLITGAGLDAALLNVDAVIDVSNRNTLRAKRSVEFFDTATSLLLAAGKRAHVRHHVALSIVGCDRVDFGYYVGKRRQEQLVLASGTGTILRATQFHEFAAQTLERGRLVAVVPRMSTQPVAAREVADELVRLAAGAPAGLAPEIAGPEQLEMPDMVRGLIRARGKRTPVVPLRLPGRVGAMMAGGALLPSGGGPRGTTTFQQWLDGEVSRNRA